MRVNDRAPQLGKYKGRIFWTILVIGLVLTVQNHLGSSLGYSLFQWMGLPAWTRPLSESGVNFSVNIGLILIVIGISGTAAVYRPVYPRILRWIMLVCVAFLWLFPYATEKLMVAVHYNSISVSSIAYQEGESSCNYKLNNEKDNVATGNCILEFYNYGKAKLVKVEPVIHTSVDHVPTVTLPSTTILLQPHRKVSTHVTFGETGSAPDDISYLSGSSNRVNFNLEVVE